MSLYPNMRHAEDVLQPGRSEAHGAMKKERHVCARPASLKRRITYPYGESSSDARTKMRLLHQSHLNVSTACMASCTSGLG